MHSSLGIKAMYIIRFSDRVQFKDGAYTNLCCASGTMKEVKEYAKNIAKKYGVTVEAIT